ncbi:MAG: hypothetical protein MUE81_09945 [Thermoflexibacter sp.]|nr:hypothetical protein [Thermoflexibacter sp.]
MKKLIILTALLISTLSVQAQRLLGWDEWQASKSEAALYQTAQDLDSLPAGIGMKRFLSIDPLARQFPYYSPYQFAGNTPIQAIDLDGAEPFDYRLKPKEAYRVDLTNINSNLVAAFLFAETQVAAMNLVSREQAQWDNKYDTEGNLTYARYGVYGIDDYDIWGQNNQKLFIAYEWIKESPTGQILGTTLDMLGTSSLFQKSPSAGLFAKIPPAAFWNKVSALSSKLESAGIVGTCDKFAGEFIGKVAPKLAESGATIRHLRFDGAGNFIFLNGEKIAERSLKMGGESELYHEFIEVTRDGKKYIYDNMNPNGMEASEWWSKFDGMRSENPRETGAALEKYVKEITVKE